MACESNTILIEPIGHWHVTLHKRIRLRVVDSTSNAPVNCAGLHVTISGPGGQRTSLPCVAGAEPGQHVVGFTPNAIGAYAVTAAGVVDGREVNCPPTPFEVVRDGEEGIRVDGNGTSYVYQIRYNWEPALLTASDSEPVRLLFELMRGIPEAAAIDWRLPFRNLFDHVPNASSAEVDIESEDGSVQEKLVPRYRGLGVYEAMRAFPVTEVGDLRDYKVRFRFVDPYNGCAVTHAKAYRLAVAGGK